MRMLTPYWTQRNFSSSLSNLIENEMSRFFDDFGDGVSGRLNTHTYDERAFDPACEISETDDHYLMSVDIPGMKKDEIKISLTDNILTLSGERKRETSTDEKNKVQRFEKSYGFFKRAFTLPMAVDAAKVEARYEDGVLELYLPKAQSAKPRQIEIQSGKSTIFDKLLGNRNADKKADIETKEARSQ